MLSIISPFQSICDYYPYLTVFEKNVNKIAKKIKKSKNGMVIGVTNPVFVKTFSHIPNILRLDQDFEKRVLKKNLILRSVWTNT